MSAPSDHEVFPLIGSRNLVDRPGRPDDSLRGYAFRYSGEGRLARASGDQRWDGVRASFAAAGELSKESEIYFIEDGLAPRHGLRLPAATALWSLLCATCLAIVLRRAFAKGKT